ncbi:MAG: HTH-type transcriptional activator RhaS [Verrucomicrobiae bacterium]|nr:HTH-type transcriptional activator RhaS [Verrucomicrobiae bacterium]
MAHAPRIEQISIAKAFLNRPPFIHVMHGMLDGRSLPVHRHNFSEIVFVLGGECVHIENNTSYQVRPGDVLTILGAASHGFTNTRKFEICNVAFQPRVLAAYAAMLSCLPGYQALFQPPPRTSRRPSPREPFHLPPDELGPILKLLHNMEQEWLGKRPGYEALITGSFLQLIVALSRAGSGWGRRQEVGQNPCVATTIQFLEQHYAGPITLTALARNAHTSVTSLLRTFKQATDMTPIDYLIHLRLRKACELMANPSLPIKEITFKVGFSDSNYFARQFRKVMGMSASEFRHGQGRKAYRREKLVASASGQSGRRRVSRQLRVLAPA